MTRRVPLFTTVALLFLALAPLAHSSDDNKLNIDVVEGIVLRLVPDVTVDSVSMSPLPGLYEVIINSPGSKKGVVYLSADMRHLIVGSIIDIQKGRNLTEARHMDISRIDVSSIPLEDALVLGNPEAEHRVIVFDDPD